MGTEPDKKPHTRKAFFAFWKSFINTKQRDDTKVLIGMLQDTKGLQDESGFANKVVRI